MKWTIGMKVGGISCVALLGLVTIGSISYRSIQSMVKSNDHVLHVQGVIASLMDVLSQAKDVENGQRGFLLAGEEDYLTPFHSGSEKLAGDMRRLRDSIADPEARGRLDKLEALLDQRVSFAKANIELRRTKGFDAAFQHFKSGTGKVLTQAIHEEVGQIRKREEELLAARIQAAVDNVRMGNFSVIVGTLLLVLLLSSLSFWVTRGLTRSMSKLVRATQDIADGNLKPQVLETERSDEVGQLSIAFGSMLISLREITQQNLQGTSHLNSSAAEILAATQEQTASAKEQAASVQETSTMIEEIKQSGMQIAERSKRVAASAETTSVSTGQGLSAVRETTQIMSAIRQQVESVAENVVGLSLKTQTVGEIIATVNDIANQSNLLALNAAIEAVSAGEHGSRFAVVAGEVRTMADKAKEATAQVRAILGEIQKGITASVMLTEEAVKRVESGLTKAETAEQTIHKLTGNIQESIETYQQILAGTNQQQIGIEQVAQALQQIRLAVEQTAASTSQQEKAVANLNALGVQLQKAVGRYRV